MYVPRRYLVPIQRAERPLPLSKSASTRASSHEQDELDDEEEEKEVKKTQVARITTGGARPRHTTTPSRSEESEGEVVVENEYSKYYVQEDGQGRRIPFEDEFAFCLRCECFGWACTFDQARGSTRIRSCDQCKQTDHANGSCKIVWARGKMAPIWKSLPEELQDRLQAASAPFVDEPCVREVEEYEPRPNKRFPGSPAPLPRIPPARDLLKEGRKRVLEEEVEAPSISVKLESRVAPPPAKKRKVEKPAPASSRAVRQGTRPQPQPLAKAKDQTQTKGKGKERARATTEEVEFGQLPGPAKGGSASQRQPVAGSSSHSPVTPGAAANQVLTQYFELSPEAQELVRLFIAKA